MEVGAAGSSSSASWAAGTRGGAGRASGAGRDEPNDSAEAKPAGVGADPGFGDGVAAARTVKASVVSSGAGVATGFGEGFGVGFGVGFGPGFGRLRTCGRGGRRPGGGGGRGGGRGRAGSTGAPAGERGSTPARSRSRRARDGRPDGLGRRCGPDGLGRRCGARGRRSRSRSRSRGRRRPAPGPGRRSGRSHRRGGLDRLGAVGLPVGHLVGLLVGHLADDLVGLRVRRPLRRRTGPGGAHGDRHDLLDRRGHRRRRGSGRPAATDHLTRRGDEVGDADEAPEREHEELHDRRRVADHRELHAGDAEPRHAEHEGEPRARRHLPAGPRAGDRRRCAPLRLPAHTYLLDGSDDPHLTDRTDTGGRRTVRPPRHGRGTCHPPE